jgi:hypothetical protein
MSKSKEEDEKVIAGCVAMLFLMPLIWLLYAFMFQYSLYTVTGKDIDFGLDFLIAIMLYLSKPLRNISFAAFIICSIYRILEYPVPMNLFGAQ